MENAAVATDAPASPAVEPALAPAGAPARSGADQFMCRLFCIPTERPRVDERQVQRLFSASIFLSATRCLLSYIVLPIVLPIVGAASSVGPYVGIPVAVLALVFDVKGARRFWLANHQRRWAFTALYAVVATMVTYLLVADIVHLFS